MAPTGATSPTPTRISESTPADVAGTSIETLSVSISNRLSPGFTASPADLNHLVILPSLTVSPSCGIRMFIGMPPPFCSAPPHLLRSSPRKRGPRATYCGIRTSGSGSPLSRGRTENCCAARGPRSSPIHRYVLRLQELHQPLMRAFAADAGLLHATERRRRIGDEAAIEPDHAKVELFGDAHAAAQVLGVEIGDQAIFSVIGAADDLVLGLEGLQRRDRPEDLLVQHRSEERRVGKAWNA